MHKDRDVELAGEPEERPRVVVVRIGTAMARTDQHAAQVVLLHGAFELAQMVVAAARDCDRDCHHAVLMLVPQRRQIVVRLADRRQRVLARIGLEVMAGVRDHAEVQPDLVVQAQHVVDGGRAVAAPERRRLLARRMHMGVPVDDHVGSYPSDRGGMCAFTACARSSSSFTSVPQPGPVGTMNSPFWMTGGGVCEFALPAAPPPPYFQMRALAMNA